MKKKPAKSKSKASARQKAKGCRRPSFCSASHWWNGHWRNAKGRTWSMDSTDLIGLLEMAAEGNAVAITLFRGRKCGPSKPIENYLGLPKPNARAQTPPDSGTKNHG